jgi:hypothetical protein
VPGLGAAPPLPARRAAARAVPIALALGFLFAARATPLFLLAAFVVLWRGIGARPLALAAGTLLVVVAPALTLAIPVRDRGGYNTDYPVDRIAVHWVAVAAVALLALALLRALSTARARPGPGPGAPPSAGARPAAAP